MKPIMQTAAVYAIVTLFALMGKAHAGPFGINAGDEMPDKVSGYSYGDGLPFAKFYANKGAQIPPGFDEMTLSGTEKVGCVPTFAVQKTGGRRRPWWPIGETNGSGETFGKVWIICGGEGFLVLDVHLASQ